MHACASAGVAGVDLLERGEWKTPVMRVPAGAPATMPKSPRLRRVSPIAKFAAAAAMEAMGGRTDAAEVGVVFCLSNGCVNYSNRFFTEALADPATASPILFPETVFNAPSSHLSAMLGSHAPNDTLIADAAGFFCGMDLAIDWLLRGEVRGCLVVCAEEIDWLSAEGLRLYHGELTPSEGAAALYLEAGEGEGIDLLRLPDPVPYSSVKRQLAPAILRRALAADDDGATLLVDGLTGVAAVDAAEAAAWRDWRGPRWSPRVCIGESMGASAGLQCAAAVAAVAAGKFERAVVCATGANQQAGGMVIGAPRRQ
jgi:3-oxoacyl-(acyl-carrier-protein) synthase